MFNSQFSNRRGFTLIEVLVSISILSILILIVLSLFTRFVFTQRRDIGEQALQEEVRFALELLNREVRTGYASTYTTDGSFLFLRNQNGTCVAYRLLDEALVRGEREADDPQQECGLVGYEESDYQRLTSDETRIERLEFSGKTAAARGDVLQGQGYVTIRLRARAVRKASNTLAVQSSVASRQVTVFKAEAL